MEKLEGRPPRPKLVLIAVGMGTLLSAMASSTATLALPSIGSNLGISLARSNWVIQSFLLAVAVLLLVAGQLGDRIGHRRVYLTGFVLFGAASLLCGLSPNFWLLILARLLQGIGAAFIIASSPALLTTSFSANQRGQALGIQSTAIYIGLTLGPPTGGLIIGWLGWRWVFFINVPVTVVVLGLGLRYLPPRHNGQAPRLDGAEVVSLVGGLSLLLLALSQGHDWGWTSWATLDTGTIGLLILAAFARHEWTRKNPLLDLRLFQSRAFTGAVLSAICNYIALFVPAILLPFYLNEGLGLTPGQFGMLLAIQPLVMAVVASPSGALSDRIGTHGLATAGMLVMFAALLGMATLNGATPLLAIGLWLAVIGLGTGIFISPNSSALMGAAPRHQQGIAGGVLGVARTIGMIAGIAAATSLFYAHGGQTGRAWGTTDFHALHVALIVAGLISALGALAAWWGRNRKG